MTNLDKVIKVSSRLCLVSIIFTISFTGVVLWNSIGVDGFSFSYIFQKYNFIWLIGIAPVLIHFNLISFFTGTKQEIDVASDLKKCQAKIDAALQEHGVNLEFEYGYLGLAKDGKELILARHQYKKPAYDGTGVVYE